MILKPRFMTSQWIRRTQTHFAPGTRCASLRWGCEVVGRACQRGPWRILPWTSSSFNANLLLIRAIVVITTCFVMPTLADEVTDKLPGTVVGWVRLNHVDRWPSQMEASALTSLLGREEFEDFRRELKSLTLDDALINDIGLNWEEIAQLTRGNVVLAWMELAPGQFAFLAALEARGQPEKIDVALASVDQRLGSRRVPGKPLKFEGTDVLRYETDDRQQRCFARWGSWLLISDDVAAIGCLTEPPNKRLLTDRKSYRTIARETFANPTAASDGATLDWYLRQWPLIASRDVEPGKVDYLQLAHQLGFDAVTGVGGAAQLSSQSAFLTYRTAICRGKPLRDAARMVSFKSESLVRLPGWVSDQVSFIRGVHLDLDQMLSGFGTWFDATYGEGDEGLFQVVLRDIRDEPDGPQVDVQAELLRFLTGPIYTISMPSKSETEQTSRVLAVQTRRAEVTRKAVDRLMRGDPDVEPIKLREFKAWRFGDLSRNGTRQILGPDLSGVTLCVTNEYVLIARDESTMRWAVASNSSRQSSTATFNRIFDFSRESQFQRPFLYQAARGMGNFSQIYRRLRMPPSTDAKTEERPVLAAVTRMTSQLRSLETVSRLRQAALRLPTASTIAPHFHGDVLLGEVREDAWLLVGRMDAKQ